MCKLQCSHAASPVSRNEAYRNFGNVFVPLLYSTHSITNKTINFCLTNIYYKFNKIDKINAPGMVKGFKVVKTKIIQLHVEL